jgi:hypothetical protein
MLNDPIPARKHRAGRLETSVNTLFSDESKEKLPIFPQRNMSQATHRLPIIEVESLCSQASVKQMHTRRNQQPIKSTKKNISVDSVESSVKNMRLPQRMITISGE